ncbi:MAG TPA: DMT family transporter [Acetobacteraceae bacterium]|nr:DMT family transporter [Acetobacteraceae bacterium]
MSLAIGRRNGGVLRGVGLLMLTASGWGLNWAATKYLITECPPLTARGLAGLAAGFGLAALAAARGEGLAVPAQARLPLLCAALLNVTAWMGLTTVSMLWLPAGEAATLAYTMPVWAALLALPVLGERLGPARMVALALGLGGVWLLVRHGFGRDAAKLPGIAAALIAALAFALGTVLAKRRKLPLAPLAATAWQVGLGCAPLLVAGLLFERPHLLAMAWYAWAALGYTAVISLGVCYLAWFGALRRLPAGTAAIGMLLTPVIGVLASAATLGEPLLGRQLAALALVLSAVLLATR